MIWENFIVRDASGLTKFRKWDLVEVAEVVSETEVKVYKLDDCGDYVMNANNNKVRYTIKTARLKDEYANTKAKDTAGTIEKRVMEKTFSDKALDKAADLVATTNNFISNIERIKTKLSKVSSNVMQKAWEIHDSADSYDAEAFAVATADLEKVATFLKDNDIAKAISKFAKVIAPAAESDYNPEDLLD